MGKPAPLHFPIHIPFVEHLGLELHALADGEAEMRVDLATAHMNSWEVAHGGVVMTLLDVAMAHAARSEGAATGMATIEMKTSFLRPATGALRAVGRRLHRTATLAFCEAQLFDGHGRLCATASGTFKSPRAGATRAPFPPIPVNQDKP
jgi:uncharacterized protein (TIGR00369 family)